MLPLSSVDITEIYEEDLDLKWEYLEQFRLGKGGFSDIFHVFYKGYDAVLKRPRFYTPEAREEIRREATVIAALNNCENVVRLYGVCDTAPFTGMILEYCAGPNLSDLVYKLCECEIELETIRIFKWCHEMTKTLCELNATNYHGDVKAQNVLVKERPCFCQKGTYSYVTIRDTTYYMCKDCNGVHLEHLSLKICDLGMSYKNGTQRRYPGTREFNAPETYNGTYTEKSEVYSFGHLMLVLIIGKPIHECVDGQKRFLELYNNKKYDMSKCKSNSICETITWCLNEAPEDRPNFKKLLEKLNDRFNHYQSLRGDTVRRSEANLEREEFLEHYRLPRRITMASRTMTASTFLSMSTDSELDLTKEESSKQKRFGGHYDNAVYVESPQLSPSPSRKNDDGYELTRNFVENHLYTGDEDRITMLPNRSRKTLVRRSSVLTYLVDAKNRISEKIRKFVRR